MSSAAVTGVMRSTMQLGNDTCSSIHFASEGSLARAKAVIILRATSPLPGRLSHDMTVNGCSPASRRAASPAMT